MPKPPTKIFERNQQALQLANVGDVGESGMASSFNDTPKEMK